MAGANARYKLSVMLSAGMRREIDALAKRCGRSRSSLAVEMIEAALSARRPERKKTVKPAAEVAANQG